MEAINELTLDIVASYMNKEYELMYVSGYDENLDAHLDLVQEAIQKQDMQPIDEEVWEWYFEQADSSVDEIVETLIKEVASSLDLDEEYVFAFFEEHRVEIEEEIHNRDKSNIERDLLRYTKNPAMFYDTGVYIDSSEYDSKAEVMSKVRQIKRALKIPSKDKRYDNRIFIMICQASYGGRLVVYFCDDVEDYINIGKCNRIMFKDPMIAIIDNYNGSGDNTDLKLHSFSLPFDPANIFIDETLKYDYTHSVCGMYDNWCDCTTVKFWNQKMGRPVKTEKSSLHVHNEVEEKLNKTFKAGGCTHGDMDMNRHRNVYYENNYPCGFHCPKCGTFWID
jgi:hypothetical protein